MATEHWSCPDTNPRPREYGLLVPGTDEEFPDCPGYYLRTADMGLPADHLIEGATHPAQIISEWAMEVESGARRVSSMSAKGRDGVHLWLREKAKQREYDREQREKNRAR